VSEPRRRLDPLALAVHGVALALIVAAGAYLVFAIRSDPQPAQADSQAARDFLGGIAKSLEQLVEGKKKPAPLVRKPAPPPAAQSAPAARMIGPVPIKPPADMTWLYRVSVEPQTWKDATLAYRMVEEANGLAVQAEFRHASGKMNFRLGVFQPGHASHANVRFPGFFLYPAYFDRPLEVGQRLVWQWPWQLPGGAVREGRIKRYSGQVAGWENLPVPAGTYNTARIEATLEYIDGGRVMATAKETLWYSYKFAQIAKVVREGTTPDESSHRIVAELIELR